MPYVGDYIRMHGKNAPYVGAYIRMHGKNTKYRIHNAYKMNEEHMSLLRDVSQWPRTREWSDAGQTGLFRLEFG